MAITVEKDKYVAWTDTLDLVGVEYPFTFQPIGVVLAAHRRAKNLPPAEAEPVLEKAMESWMRGALGPDSWADINRRLDDENDPLHEGHLMKAFKAIMEANANRPFTSSGVASTPQQTKPSPARPSASESTSTV